MIGQRRGSLCAANMATQRVVLGVDSAGTEHLFVEPQNLSPRFEAVAGQGDSPLWRRRLPLQMSRPAFGLANGLGPGAGVNTPPPRRSRSLWQQLTPEDPPSDPSQEDASASSGKQERGRPKRSLTASAGISMSARAASGSTGRLRSGSIGAPPASRGSSTGRKRPRWHPPCDEDGKQLPTAKLIGQKPQASRAAPKPEAEPARKAVAVKGEAAAREGVKKRPAAASITTASRQPQSNSSNGGRGRGRPPKCLR